MAETKEQNWRDLQHDTAINKFKTDIKLSKYVNPDARKQIYCNLREFHTKVYQQRLTLLEEYKTLPMNRLASTVITGLIEKTRDLSSQVEERFNQFVEELKQEHEEAHQLCIERLTKLWQKVCHYAAKEIPELEEIVKRECEIEVDNLYERNTEQSKQVIGFFEETDLKSNEVLMNIGKFYNKMAGLCDQQKKDFYKLEQMYGLEKCKCADENDDRIEILNEDLEDLKEQLKMAIHHPMLDETLEKTFAKVDELEAEYRDFHQKNQDIMKTHPGLIDGLYAEFEKKCSGVFDMFQSVDKKKELEDRNLKRTEEKVAKLIQKEEFEKAEKERKQQEEQKAKGGKGSKLPAKKDAKKQQQELDERKKVLMQEVGVECVEEFDSPSGVKWYLGTTLQDWSKEMYVIKEDEDEEEQQPTEQKLTEQQLQPPLPEPSNKASPKPSPTAQDQKKIQVPVQPEVNQQEVEFIEEKEPLPCDYKHPSPLDPDNQKLLNEDVVLSVDLLIGVFKMFREHLFEYIVVQKNEKLSAAKTEDKDYMEYSIMILDERLKVHYPIKGKIEMEINQVRSAQIMDHKRKYERHTRMILDKNNFQTEQFNFVLEECLKESKNYEQNSNRLKKALDEASSLPRLQGLLNQQKDSFYKFDEKIRDYHSQLEMLTFDFGKEEENKEDPNAQTMNTMMSTTGMRRRDPNNLLEQNQLFILNCKVYKYFRVRKNEESPTSPTKEGKLEVEEKKNDLQKTEEDWSRTNQNYSQQEVEWYQSMMNQINDQIKQQLSKRKEKSSEMKEYLDKKKAEMLDIFEKSYQVALEELAAKDGTGKKYGRPKRFIQERLRTEYTKCEQAQDAINKNIQKLSELYEKFQNSLTNQDYESNVTLSQQIRKLLMIIRTCIFRYQYHIEALKPDAKVTEMPRVSYNELKFEISLLPEETEQDKKLKDLELEQLGQLYFQKEQNKKFYDWVLEIEKQVIVEVQKIYTGANIKFLTGVEKIPDYLRTYLENIKAQCEGFRINMCRQLRSSCDELSKLTPAISEIIFSFIFKKSNYHLNLSLEKLDNGFQELFERNNKKQQLNRFQLHPDLANPARAEILNKIRSEENERLETMKKEITTYRETVLDTEFDEGNNFFKIMLNNFEFLMVYYDNLILFEDFEKLPGDEEIVKKHDNLRTLLKRKQKGFIIDTSSERALTKTWPGILVHIFQVEKRQIQYRAQPQENLITDKKGKPVPQKMQQQQIQAQADAQQGQQQEMTKEIKSFKTFRQKSVNLHFQKAFQAFKEHFDQRVQLIIEKTKQCELDELKFQFDWDKIVNGLLEEQAN
eukprot:TRINITY_DN1444_c0_g1_i4.p1 TRINITY_DN1444_c0_g1~~TRINITY_DN1444_c0_g1_i4.p1  ORF type:complete len:1308 (+),score=255.89 TRINITY_DN1444_c0_g1_i4:1080-5003(+)